VRRGTAGKGVANPNQGVANPNQGVTPGAAPTEVVLCVSVRAGPNPIP
jgi:hypothetical protein